MDNSISGINFNEYIEKHSPGYVIEVFNDNKREEYVVGNRITKPMPRAGRKWRRPTSAPCG